MDGSNLFDQIPVDSSTRLAVSRSRQPGVDAEGRPLLESLAGNILPRLCKFVGHGACQTACQAPEGYENTGQECAKSNLQEVVEALGVDKDDVFIGAVCGSANVVFLDEIDREDTPISQEGFKSFSSTDAVFGYDNTVKACRLADCGLVAVSGLDKYGKHFDGFIHATRLNMNGDDQFTDDDGSPAGGVELMLKRMLRHYNPKSVDLKLGAGIAPELYVFTFEPTEQELAENPNITEKQKRENLFKGWHENGWIKPHFENGEWDGKSYEVDMFAAIRRQVANAGLIDRYDDSDVQINGDPSTGHASNRAGKLGRIPEARDLYAIVPEGYKHD